MLSAVHARLWVSAARTFAWPAYHRTPPAIPSEATRMQHSYALLRRVEMGVHKSKEARLRL